MLLLFVSFQLVGVLLWCVSWADLFYSFHELLQNRTPPPVYFVTPLIVGITVVRSCLFIVTNKNNLFLHTDGGGQGLLCVHCFILYSFN